VFLLLSFILFFSPLISSVSWLFENEFIKLILLYFYSAFFLLTIGFSLVRRQTLLIPPKKIVLTLTFFLLITLISSIFGLSPKDSLLGRYGLWQTSFLTLTVYCLIYYSSFLIFSIKEKREYFFLSLLTPSLLISLIELASRFQNLNLFSTERSISFFENPNLLGFYLCLTISLSFWLIFFTKNRLIKSISILCFLSNFLTLILTQSRTSWLVLFISFLINVFIFHPYLKRMISRKQIAIITICLLGILVICLPLIKNRLQIDTSSSRVSYKLRFQEWQTVFQIWQKYPFLGIGPENLDAIYPRFRDQKLNLVPEEWQWRSLLTRNLWLENLVTKGPLGLISFLLIGFFIFKITPKKPETIPILSLIIVYYCHSFFYFQSVSIDLLFFVSLGFLATFPKIKKFKTPPMFGIFFIIISLSLMFIISRVLLSEYFAKQSIQLFTINPEQSVQLAEKSFSLNSTFDKNLRLLCLTREEYLRSLPAENHTKILLDKYQQCLNLLEKRSDLDIENLKTLTSGHMRLASFTNSSYEKAQHYGQKLINLDPSGPGSYDTLGLVYLDSRQFEKALDTFTFIIKNLKPDYPFAYFHLGETYRQLDRPEKALAYYRKALDLGYQGALIEMNETLEEIRTTNYK
jgi:tetratricopeptide (TPR) repeat protein